MAHEFFAATGTIILSHMVLSRTCQHLLWLGNHDWVMTCWVSLPDEGCSVMWVESGNNSIHSAAFQHGQTREMKAHVTAR